MCTVHADLPLHDPLQVASKSQEGARGEKPRRQVIVEVLVNLLLEIEEISVHKALVYILCKFDHIFGESL